MNDIIRIIGKATNAGSSTLIVSKDGLTRVYKNSDKSYTVCGGKYGYTKVTNCGNSFHVYGGKKK